MAIAPVGLPPLPHWPPYASEASGAPPNALDQYQALLLVVPASEFAAAAVGPPPSETAAPLAPLHSFPNLAQGTAPTVAPSPGLAEAQEERKPVEPRWVHLENRGSAGQSFYVLDPTPRQEFHALQVWSSPDAGLRTTAEPFISMEISPHHEQRRPQNGTHLNRTSIGGSSPGPPRPKTQY
jgi:hypothetical protein